MRWRTIVFWLLTTAITLAPCGCAVPAVAGVTAGLSAAQAGSSVLVGGELRGAVYADLGTVFDAVLLAVEDLDVGVRRDRLSERSAFVLAKDDGGPEIRIRMLRRTPELTRIDIRVGVFGDLPTSRAILVRIASHLPADAISEIEFD